MKRPTGTAYRELESAIQEDPDFAWGWHCNIAMPIKDELGCTHLEANRAAARIMSHLFGTATGKHPNFQNFLSPGDPGQPQSRRVMG